MASAICKSARWTADEDAFVRENFRRMTDTEMARVLKRTYFAVQSRRRILGLVYDDGRCDASIARRARIVAQVVEGYGKVPGPVLAKRHGISRAAICGIWERAKNRGDLVRLSRRKPRETGDVAPGRGGVSLPRLRFLEAAE